MSVGDYANIRRRHRLQRTSTSSLSFAEMYATLFVFIAIIAVAMGFAPSTRVGRQVNDMQRQISIVKTSTDLAATDKLINLSLYQSSFTRQTAVNAIPSFNWPGSKMPPSPLEAIFGGGAKKAPEPVAAPPAPVKKAGLFGSFGKKAEPVAVAAPAGKGKVVAKPAAKVAAKPAAKVVAKPAAKGAVAAKKPAAAPAKKGLFGK